MLDRGVDAREAPSVATLFGEATRAWFEETFEAPTPVQAQGWARVAAGEHTLMLAPTGSGKTLAAFLYELDRLSRGPTPRDGAGVRVLYVSPLKALVYDVERNLRSPRVGIRRAAERLGLDLTLPRVSVRTGDTTGKERRDQARHPGEILVTTPESLYLVLGSQARETLRTVETVIVDEVHALAPTKRGAHLALSLERLCALTGGDPQRIGLSATARPTDAVARYLGGDRPVAVVDTSMTPRLDLSVVVPVPDMTQPDEPAPDADGGTSLLAPDEPPARSIWPAVYPRLLELIRAHATTIVFVNSRGLCERLAQHLNEAAGEELVLAHHGSVAHEARRQIEEALKAGRVKGIVATSSLELGIDMGAVDLVVLVESPGAVSRGLQRVGRAGHGVGEISVGRIFPKHRGDLLESAVVARRMMDGAIEALRVPRNPLDVLAQQIVAACAVEPWSVDALRALVTRCASFRELPDDALTGVLDMLSGRYPTHDFAELSPRIVWDREADVLTGRRGAKMLSLVSGGTIPDRGLYAVHLGEGGPRIGELDEEMVHETSVGQTITLGASTWRVDQITRDRVLVQPAPGEPGRLPFWRGEGPGRPVELGRQIGAFVRTVGDMGDDDAERWLQQEHRLDPFAARNLVAYVREQREVTGTLPTDRALTVERFRDEVGDHRVCILSPFGARVHAPWALAVQARLEAELGFEVQAMWSDDGIVLSLADGDELPDTSALLPDPDEVEDRLVDQLSRSALFASQFRENAARALLLPRRRPGSRTPLWAQRLRSQKLLAVAQRYPSFPMVIETYRSCMQDVFDLPSLLELLRGVRERRVRVDEVQTGSASPFARSLVFAWVAAYLYEGDTPLAERRAQALSLDRQLLRELLGQEELRELLDAAVIDELEDELQHLAEDRRARHADAVHDLLRRLGDLSPDELAARVDGDSTAMVEALARARRALSVRVAGEARFIAVEDASLYRDGLGVALPPGLPEVFLEPGERPVEALVARWARTHGPFEAAAVARRFGMPVGAVDAALRSLEAAGAVISGEFRPGGTRREHCDPEILRRIKRRTLARLRNEVAPVSALTLARFLPAWHGVALETSGGARVREGRLEEALEQLEALPLSYGELEGAILPARVPGFSPRHLDELGAMGWLVWVGHGALGRDDGRIGLYRRDRITTLLEPAEPPEALEPLHRTLLDHLDSRGASFFADLLLAAAPAPPREALEALWDLVWLGLVTNDTFQALRSLRARHDRRGRRGRGPVGPGGRWSLVRTLVAAPPSPTERAHARAVLMLERHGVVSREAAALEGLPGGFSALYRVLRAMEDAGKVRRGHFVEGLGGAQFAYPGAVDRMRAHRDGDGDRRALVLSAVDPASPWGWLLPWPETTDPASRPPRRAAGAQVISVDGELVMVVDRGGRRLRTFTDSPALLAPAAAALVRVARGKRGRMLRVETIDGEPARASRHAALLREASFGADHKGLVLEA